MIGRWEANHMFICPFLTYIRILACCTHMFLIYNWNNIPYWCICSNALNFKCPRRANHGLLISIACITKGRAAVPGPPTTPSGASTAEINDVKSSNRGKYSKMSCEIDCPKQSLFSLYKLQPQLHFLQSVAKQRWEAKAIDLFWTKSTITQNYTW